VRRVTRSHEKPGPHDPPGPGRLPRHVLPRHYTLELRPDLDACTFTGTVAIDAEVVVACSRVLLNASELEVESATAVVGDLRCDLVATLDEAAEHVALTGVDLAPGPVRLELSFTGVLNNRLRGFYRSTLMLDGTEHTIATTQFQSTDARRAFPCFDEPDLKATFGVTLVVDSDLLAVSNGAETSRTPVGDGTDRVVFADTIPLSTYLVAFVIGPLEATDPIEVDGVPVRVIYPPGKGDQTAFALDVAAHSLRWLAAWYDLAVPGGKVDLVALPDFAFGAMENLGCITFREVLLLVDPETADQRELESVAAVLSHELAHLWFGDLVTMRWWNGIWLNEAFATFMEMKAVEAFRPDWEVWAGFTAARSAAMDVDALTATRPIEYPVITPADAESMFDLLTYEKGAAVVRMLEQFLGEDAFRDGVRRYLAAHLYGNTDNEDLWAALEEASGQPVGDLMEGWIFRGGHPLVEAVVSASLDADDTSCRLSQRPFRYLDEPVAEEHSSEDLFWQVPVRLRTTVGEHRVLLGSEPLDVLLDGPLLTVNSGATGFHRSVGLDGIDPAALTAVERAANVDDCWATTLAEFTEPTEFMNLAATVTGRPGGEADLAVWQAVLRGLGTIDLVAPERHAHWATAAADLLAEVVERLGWVPQPDEDDRTRQLRGSVLTAAGTLADDPAVLAEARRRWDDPTIDSAPAVAAAVTIITATHGNAAIRAECRRRAEDAVTAQDEQRHLRALALFPDDPEVGNLLAEVHDGTIRTQDAPFLIRLALTHPTARGAVWRSVTDRWDDLTGLLPSNSIARMLEGIRALVGEVDPDVDSFLNDHPVPQGALMVAQHRERRLVNQRLRRRLLDS